MTTMGQSPGQPPSAGSGAPLQIVPPIAGAPGPGLGPPPGTSASGQALPPLAAPGQAVALGVPGMRMAGIPLASGGGVVPPVPATMSTGFGTAAASFGRPPMMPSYMSAPPPVPLPQVMPPGVIANSPAGMPPRYSAPPFTPLARAAPNYSRPPLGPPPATMSSITLPRPPGNGLRPLPPVLKPPPGLSLTELAAKGVGQLAAAPEKPHTTVYVGKIAPTIEDDFLRALLELCGEIKSWKRAQDPTTGSPKGFGFCEFESAEGVLRALRILSKFSLEGQELVLNVNQATREYLERYVAKKKEKENIERQAAEADKEEELAPGVDSVEAPKPPSHLFGKDEASEKNAGGEEDAKKFGLVTAADIQADETALKKLSSMLEERSRLRPLPPPPPLPSNANGLTKSLPAIEGASKSKDGDLAQDAARNADDSTAKSDDTSAIDHKAAADNEKGDTTIMEKTSRRSERDRERERERELEREKERELERYERDRERERMRREKERDQRVREAERLYEEREREWDLREREKERQRIHDRDREKDRERDRRKEVKEQEEESEDDDWKRSRRRSTHDEKRKRRIREREEDLADREREEQENFVKRQKNEESANAEDGSVGSGDDDMDVADDSATYVSVQGAFLDRDGAQAESESDVEDDLPQKMPVSNGAHADVRQMEGSVVPAANDGNLKASPAPRKLGFGIMGAGRRATGLSVFHQEDEEEKTDDRRLRPLVPIDYSVEEMEAVAVPNPVKPSSPQVSAPNLAAAAEFARSLFQSTTGSAKENRKEDGDKDRSKRRKDRPPERDAQRKERSRERERERDREREAKEHRDRAKERERKELDKVQDKDHGTDKPRTGEPKKILNAKQLIDTIPKTKEELFAYPVDWSLYDKHDLHEKVMRRWVSTKITEFLGEEETTLVDFIVSNTCKHVTAASMLELLEPILDDEAELFVLKMWRILIFEIRRIEAGLATFKTK